MLAGADVGQLQKVFTMMTSVVVSIMLAQDAQRRGDAVQRDFLIRAAFEQARTLVEFVNNGQPDWRCADDPDTSRTVAVYESRPRAARIEG